MKNKFKVSALVLCGFLLSIGGGVLGAAAQDRLSAIFNVGQGSAGSKAMVFDSGNGSSNVQISSTANTNMSLKVNAATPLALTATQIQVLDGSSSVPSITFGSDTDTGIYAYGAGVIGLVSNTNAAGRFGGGSWEAPSGNVSNPGYGFQDDDDTGMYASAANQLAFATGGTQRAVLDSSGLYVASAISSSGAVDAGNNGTGIKWHVYTGTAIASGTLDFTGLGSHVVGAIGRTTFDGSSSDWRAMPSVINSGCASGTASCIAFQVGANADEVIAKNNDTNSSNDYYITIFYQ